MTKLMIEGFAGMVLGWIGFILTIQGFLVGGTVMSLIGIGMISLFIIFNVEKKPSKKAKT